METQEDLLIGWREENKRALYKKMQNKGIQQGGIFSETKRNIALFDQLTQEFKEN